MKKILSKMYGFLEERAIIDGMEEFGSDYNFSKAIVKCWVSLTEENITTEFTVFPKSFCNSKDALYTTNSFKELREWLEQHKEELE